MIVNTPFFISPAYCVPRITSSLRAKLSATDVDDDMPAGGERGVGAGGFACTVDGMREDRCIKPCRFAKKGNARTARLLSALPYQFGTIS